MKLAIFTNEHGELIVEIIVLECIVPYIIIEYLNLDIHIRM